MAFHLGFLAAPKPVQAILRGRPATHADRMPTYLMDHQACGRPLRTGGRRAPAHYRPVGHLGERFQGVGGAHTRPGRQSLELEFLSLESEIGRNDIGSGPIASGEPSIDLGTTVISRSLSPMCSEEAGNQGPSADEEFGVSAMGQPWASICQVGFPLRFASPKGPRERPMRA